MDRESWWATAHEVAIPKFTGLHPCAHMGPRQAAPSSNEFRVERNTPRGQRAEFYSETCRNTEGYKVGGARVERDEGMESVRQEQGV